MALLVGLVLGSLWTDVRAFPTFPASIPNGVKYVLPSALKTTLNSLYKVLCVAICAAGLMTCVHGMRAMPPASSSRQHRLLSYLNECSMNLFQSLLTFCSKIHEFCNVSTLLLMCTTGTVSGL